MAIRDNIKLMSGGKEIGHAYSGGISAGYSSFNISTDGNEPIALVFSNQEGYANIGEQSFIYKDGKFLQFPNMTDWSTYGYYSNGVVYFTNLGTGRRFSAVVFTE